MGIAMNQMQTLTKCFIAILLERCPTGVMTNIPVNDIFSGCLQAYTSDSEDRTPFYGPNWIPLKNSSHFKSVGDICPEAWKYQSASQIDTLPHDAVKETYDGGGYVADLGYNKETASDVVRELRAHNWVDERTAAVFIEFTLFDPSTRLFCNVRNVHERLPTGQAITAVHVTARSLFLSPNVNFQSFYEVCQLLFLIAIVAFFIVEMINCFRQKKYFRQVWNWVELLLLVVSFSAVVVSFLKGKFTSLYVKKIQTNPYQSFSADYIIRLLDLETFLLSVAVFIITLKILRLAQFNRHICQMQGTLRSSMQPILSFSLVFAVAVVALTQFGYLCFGTKLANFSSFSESLRVVLQMAVGGSIDNEEIHQKYPILGPMFLFFILMVMLFILINVFVAILVGAYDNVKKNQGDTIYADAELGCFMYSVFLKRIKDLPGHLTSVLRVLLKKSSRKPPAKAHFRHTNYTRVVGSIIKSKEKKAQDGVELDIEFEIFQPVNDITIPRAFSGCLDAEDDSDVEEDSILVDIKSCFKEISSELRSLSFSSYHTSQRTQIETRL